jgi:hypothetical protein
MRPLQSATGGLAKKNQELLENMQRSTHRAEAVIDPAET